MFISIIAVILVIIVTKIIFKFFDKHDGDDWGAGTPWGTLF